MAIDQAPSQEQIALIEDAFNKQLYALPRAENNKIQAIFPNVMLDDVDQMRHDVYGSVGSSAIESDEGETTYNPMFFGSRWDKLTGRRAARPMTLNQMVRMNKDPRSPIVSALMQGVSLDIDIKVYINAILGLAQVATKLDPTRPGEMKELASSGTKSRRIPVNASLADPTGAITPIVKTGLTIEKMQLIRRLFVNSDAGDQRYILISSSQANDLVNDPKISNSFYSDEKRAITGSMEMGQAYGTKYIEFPDYFLEDYYDTATKVLKCPVLTSSAMICRMPRETSGSAGRIKIDERPDKWGNWQAVVVKFAACVRLKDKEVGYIECYQPDFNNLRFENQAEATPATT